MITSQFSIESIESKINNIRGHQVMHDSDLAKLYEVSTKSLNQTVKRNLERFPADFMLQLIDIERENLRSQFVTSSLNYGSSYGGRRYLSYAFTELGIVMLSSVLKSPQAIQVNISIIRVFFELRKLLHTEKKLESKLEKIEENTNILFQMVFKRIESLEANAPILSPHRRKVGI